MDLDRQQLRSTNNKYVLLVNLVDTTSSQVILMDYLFIIWIRFEEKEKKNKEISSELPVEQLLD